MSTLGVCVLGAGDMGTVHAAAWQSVPETELLSVADPLSERAERNRERFGFRHCFSNYLDALDIPGVRAASVAVPSHLHAECAQAAMARGVHVLCEKPISLCRRRPGDDRRPGPGGR